MLRREFESRRVDNKILDRVLTMREIEGQRTVICKGYKRSPPAIRWNLLDSVFRIFSRCSFDIIFEFIILNNFILDLYIFRSCKC